jgi:hypothetical protein
MGVSCIRETQRQRPSLGAQLARLTPAREFIMPMGFRQSMLELAFPIFYSAFEAFEMRTSAVMTLSQSREVYTYVDSGFLRGIAQTESNQSTKEKYVKPASASAIDTTARLRR